MRLPPPAGAALAAAYALASSWLGLAGTRTILRPAETWQLFAAVWSTSLVADAIFVLGSLAVAWGAYAHAERPALAVAGAFAASWLVYWASYVALVLAAPGAFLDVPFVDAALFVLAWGWIGLAFASIAPALVRRLRAA